MPGSREHPSLGARYIELRRRLYEYAASEREIGLARPQALASRVERDEGARAGGIDGDRGPTQVQQVSDPGRRDRRGVAPKCLRRRVAEEAAIVAAVAADVDARLVAIDRPAHVARIF